MPVLSAADMATFRALTQDLAFHDTYALQRDTNTPDDAGGWTTVEATVESGPCDVAMGLSRPDERAVADRARAIAPYVITLPYATSATASDRILVAGRTFEIVDVLKDGFLGVDARAVCEEVG
jgi:head-tail adaptor